MLSIDLLNLFAEAAMGVQVNAQNDPDFPYIKALKRWAFNVIVINTILTLSFPFLQCGLYPTGSHV